MITFVIPPTHPAADMSIRDRAAPHTVLEMQVRMWRCSRGLHDLESASEELGLWCISDIALHAALKPRMLRLAKGLEQSLLLRNCSFYIQTHVI